MKTVIQRVSQAHVIVDGKTTGQIVAGLLVLVGFTRNDDEGKLDFHVKKLPTLRIFPDGEGRMNRSVRDIGGGILVVSQFTLAGDCRKGTRPSFDSAMAPNQAEALYNRFISRLRYEAGVSVETGIFGAMMAVHLVNDGPLTLILEN